MDIETISKLPGFIYLADILSQKYFVRIKIT